MQQGTIIMIKILCLTYIKHIIEVIISTLFEFSTQVKSYNKHHTKNIIVNYRNQCPYVKISFVTFILSNIIVPSLLMMFNETLKI